MVVGGTGFLGRHICAALTARGNDVVAVARRPGPPVEGAHVVQLDAARGSLGDLVAVLKDADLVVSAAGDVWADDEARMAAAHVTAVDRLLDAMARLPHRPRLVHLGSVHEYGPVPDGVRVAEDRPAAPVSVHGRTKLAGTQAVLRSVCEGRVDGCVLRVVNACGPGTPEYSFVGRLAARLRARTGDTPLDLTVADDRRDYIDARDVAEAVDLAARAPVTGRIINIGRGTATGMRQIADLLVRASGIAPHLVRESGGTVRGRGAGWTCVDNTLAHRLLGWAPRVPLETSLRDTWTASAVPFGAGDPGTADAAHAGH
ncbi:reductase [Streptomyces violaceusniger]|uniref:Reductase n=1 Tax=Streptomyces violaceusniger TaxID=68280 RepID=A0A4D4KYN0_STRVO|nr:reductase [Streptomyces violaceusniger]